jgi:hypothetical protein
MKFIAHALLLVTLMAACKNQTTPPPVAPVSNDASAILKHKYWVTKQFNDAFFAPNITDTLSYLPCAELIFTQGDSLLLTACLSDAGRGNFKVTGLNTLSVTFEGFESKACAAHYDEKTGILHVDAPDSTNTGWPTDFVAQDEIDVKSIDDVTVNLGRKRLAGNYTKVTGKGEVATTSLLELHADGTQIGFGNFDTYEPWPSGEGSTFIQDPQRLLMYWVTKGKESDPMAVGYQVHGDTLRIWDTKNINAKGDMPEYKITKLKGTYLKAK